MTRLPALLLAGGTALWLMQGAAAAADFEVNPIYDADHLSCLAMAREEARYIVEISLLHPFIKHHEHDAVRAHRKALKHQKRAVQHESERVECI